MKSEQEIDQLALKIYKEDFEGEPLTDTSIIDAIKLGYIISQKERQEKQMKLASSIRELFSSISHSSKKYDELLKELYK
jgi:hypothetical protein